MKQFVYAFFIIAGFSAFSFAFADSPDSIATFAPDLSVEMSAEELASSYDSDDGEFQGCAEVSLRKMNYVMSDCKRVQNDAQDRCAGFSIEKFNYVMSDCLRLDAGGRCAVVSLQKKNYVMSDCKRITNSRQDRCAATSLKTNGYVTSSCFSL